MIQAKSVYRQSFMTLMILALFLIVCMTTTVADDSTLSNVDDMIKDANDLMKKVKHAESVVNGQPKGSDDTTDEWREARERIAKGRKKYLESKRNLKFEKPYRGRIKLGRHMTGGPLSKPPKRDKLNEYRAKILQRNEKLTKEEVNERRELSKKIRTLYKNAKPSTEALLRQLRKVFFIQDSDKDVAKIWKKITEKYKANEMIKAEQEAIKNARKKKKGRKGKKKCKKGKDKFNYMKLTKLPKDLEEQLIAIEDDLNTPDALDDDPNPDFGEGVKYDWWGCINCDGTEAKPYSHPHLHRKLYGRNKGKGSKGSTKGKGKQTKISKSSITVNSIKKLADSVKKLLAANRMKPSKNQIEPSLSKRASELVNKLAANIPKNDDKKLQLLHKQFTGLYDSLLNAKNKGAKIGQLSSSQSFLPSDVKLPKLKLDLSPRNTPLMRKLLEHYKIIVPDSAIAAEVKSVEKRLKSQVVSDKLTQYEKEQLLLARTQELEKAIARRGNLPQYVKQGTIPLHRVQKVKLPSLDGPEQDDEEEEISNEDRLNRVIDLEMVEGYLSPAMKTEAGALEAAETEEAKARDLHDSLAKRFQVIKNKVVWGQFEGDGDGSQIRAKEINKHRIENPHEPLPDGTEPW